MKTLIISFLLVGVAFGEVSRDCQNLFMQYKHPYACCKYPLRKILDSDQKNCKVKCLGVMNDHDCCILNCNFRDTGVSVNGVFNDQALLKLYENYLEETGAGKYDKWMLVVERSIEKCVELIPHTNKIYTCNIPEYVMDMIDCVNLMNYLDCPTFERTVECDMARKFVKNLDKCGKQRNGTILVEPEYWEYELINPTDMK